ncbi:MAG: TerB family tellurite resistance protein [Hyphomicrobiaceae bacterium]
MPWKILGKVLGLDQGGVVRTAFEQIMAAFGFDRSEVGTPAQNRVAFTISVVTLAAKMSKADGVSSDVEVAAFERLFDVPEGERNNLRRVFDLARQDVAGYESYARKIGAILADEPDLKISVLECLLYMATADGVHHPAEEEFLSTVAELLGVPKPDYLAARRAFVQDPDCAYEILGVEPNATDAQIKARYRELAREHHPDLLISKGVPEEFLAASGRRLAAINEAYETIMAQRSGAQSQRLEHSS